MSRVVFKYPLPALGVVQEITMDAEAKLLHIAEQGGTICMWAEVTMPRATAVRRFIVVGTGHPFDFSGTYVGTVLVMGGAFVWHVYEVVS
jgi:hypothetical protein